MSDDIWTGTCKPFTTPASVRMVGTTPRAFIGGRMVFGENETMIFQQAFCDIAKERESAGYVVAKVK